MGPHTVTEWTDFYHCQAFSTQVSGVEMSVLGHHTSPNPWDLFTPNPNDMESQEVYNSVPRQQGTGDDTVTTETLGQQSSGSLEQQTVVLGLPILDSITHLTESA